jgi:carbamoyltransferase
MKHYLGISAGFHDAAAAVVRSDGDILFAGHSERYSKIKNDPVLHPDLLRELCEWQYHTVGYYERPWMHNIQRIWSAQGPIGPWTTRGALQQHLGQWYQHPAAQERCWPHHLCHAAAGFQTSPFDQAAVVVIDAIGELDTISIYEASYHNGRARYRRRWRQVYPHSIGLFYSAITEAVGLRPMEDEYITMGMAAYGNNSQCTNMFETFVKDVRTVEFRHNHHIGIDPDLISTRTDQDTACCAQIVVESLIENVIQRAQHLTRSLNLVYMGGVALNCVANRNLGKYFANTWIMPNPGDAGSSLGAAALAHGGRLNWQHAYLGHVIPGPYPVDAALHQLYTNKIVGVASGAAEFGPRALGNRSLLADPRDPHIKQRVNDIKHRQQYRPFAPAILEELCSDYFHMPPNCKNSRYMQVVSQCRYPELFPAIAHVDGTSRVQTVPQDGSGFRRLLEAWYQRTGCPMLLNTSLNIRGEPMVNDLGDARRFEQLYGVPVVS